MNIQRTLLTFVAITILCSVSACEVELDEGTMDFIGGLIKHIAPGIYDEPAEDMDKFLAPEYVKKNEDLDMPAEDKPEPNLPEQSDLSQISDVGEILTDKYRVLVHQGVASEFSTTPVIYAANFSEYPNPPGARITYNADLVFPYYTTMSFPNAGSWIEITVEKPSPAIGVQLWGDYADGYAQVLLDGTPVWQGYTKYENCAFDTDGFRLISEETCHGGFFYYIEVDGLDNTVHTRRVLNLGGGETTVAYFGVGKVKK